MNDQVMQALKAIDEVCCKAHISRQEHQQIINTLKFVEEHIKNLGEALETANNSEVEEVS